MTAPSPRPAAPDTTGELRESLTRFMVEWDNEQWDRTDDEFREWYRTHAADAVLALPALRDLLAERDTLAAKVAAVEGLAERAERHGYDVDPDDLRDALHGTDR